MTAVSPIPPRPTPAAKYANGAQWLHGLGDVPLERILMNPPPGTATEQDVARLVEGDNKRLVELVDGTLVEKAVGTKESFIASLLITALNSFILPRKLGYVTGEAGPYRLRASRVRMPDVAFIAAETLPSGKPPDEAIWSASPTIAAEIISESNTKLEMQKKLEDYFASGSKLVWFIYPKTRSVAVYEQLAPEPTRVLKESETLDGGSILPGFSLKLSYPFSQLS